jgi:3-methyladenine DNA glycosylase Tag
MRSFDELFEIAAKRQGGAAEVGAKLHRPSSFDELSAIPNDRWLARMTEAVFQAGFNWKVVQNMWPGFESAFEGFDPARVAMMDDDWFDRLVTDTRIVRHGPKIRATRDNAVFVTEILKEAGGAGAWFAGWPASDYVGLLDTMKKRGSRLGGTTGQYFLRFQGVDSFILSRDVVARLEAEGVVDGSLTSKKAMRSIQDAFNQWVDQSGRSLTEISRVLAMSISA